MKKKREPMTLEQAKAKCRDGNSAYPDWFGKGWSMVFHPRTDNFYDRNPVTGTLLLHTFGSRDQCDWFEGVQPKNLTYDD